MREELEAWKSSKVEASSKAESEYYNYQMENLVTKLAGELKEQIETLKEELKDGWLKANERETEHATKTNCKHAAIAVQPKQVEMTYATATATERRNTRKPKVNEDNYIIVAGRAQSKMVPKIKRNMNDS